MQIAIIGPPGCGKGTQAKRLSEVLGVPHLSTGDMLRDAMAARTTGAREIAELINHGNLASDALIMELVRQRLAQRDCEPGCLFDGVPRTVPQLQALDLLLGIPQRQEGKK